MRVNLLNKLGIFFFKIQNKNRTDLELQQYINSNYLRSVVNHSGAYFIVVVPNPSGIIIDKSIRTDNNRGIPMTSTSDHAVADAK